MCAHAVITCYFIKLCDCFTLHDVSDETVKECLSHRCVMKLHRHTSHENDEMRTHEWPKFVQDDVEETAFDKKTQKCLTRHVQMVCSYMTSHRIYKTYCHWREELFLHEFNS